MMVNESRKPQRKRVYGEGNHYSNEGPGFGSKLDLLFALALWLSFV